MACEVWAGRWSRARRVGRDLGGSNEAVAGEAADFVDDGDLFDAMLTLQRMDSIDFRRLHCSEGALEVHYSLSVAHQPHCLHSFAAAEPAEASPHYGSAWAVLTVAQVLEDC